MRPPQAIDISGQTFTPERSRFLRSKVIEPTTRQDILLWKRSGPGIPDLHNRKGRLNPTHPARPCSSASVPPPISSRTGPRFPGRPSAGGEDDCSSCTCWEAADRDPLNPRRVRSRSSAPAASVSSFSLSRAFLSASSTRASGKAVFRKCERVTVFFFSVRARASARFRCILTKPTHPIQRAYKNSQ